MTDTSGDMKQRQDGGVALCLSGGGLRATLFHLGVVKALRHNGLLKSVTEIYAVSGGSIIAAHMRCNWGRYVGSDQDFAKAEQELRRFALRNVRDRVLRRWLLTGALGALLRLIPKPVRLWKSRWTTNLFSRTYWLQREYDRLLRGATFNDSPEQVDGSGAPAFNFLATSFKTGELCSFSNAGFEIELRDSVTGEAARTPCTNFKLSFAVAASSAFPPMFPPLLVDDDMLANPADERFKDSILLSDGGVFDNLGIEKFERVRKRAKQPCARLLISDAGASFKTDPRKTFAGIIARNVRASDILMHRVGDHAKAVMASLSGIEDIAIRLSSQVDRSPLDKTVQQRLRLVRTDLDRFEPALADLLIRHGESVAAEALGAPQDTTGSARPKSADIDAQNDIARRAADRAFWSLPFDLRDWTVIPLLAIALLVAGAVAKGWMIYRQASLAEEKARADERASLELLSRTAKSARNAIAQGDNAGAYRQLSVALQAAQTELEVKQKPETASRPTPTLSPPSIFQLPATDYEQSVYIQFYGFDRATITGLNASLRQARWHVQGASGERIETPFTRSEVRYSGHNAAAANALAQAINMAMETPGRVVPTRMPIIRPDTLEVWVSAVPGPINSNPQRK